MNNHRLVNHKDTKLNVAPKKLTCKETLRQVFIRVYKLEIQSVMSLECWVLLDTIFWGSLTLCIWPDSEPTKLLDNPKQKPRRNGGLRRINICRQVPFQVKFFRWRHFALLSISLLFLSEQWTRQTYCAGLYKLFTLTRWGLIISRRPWFLAETSLRLPKHFCYFCVYLVYKYCCIA